jgi:hypothetical protein
VGFILKGFTQEMGIRVFAFERVGEDQKRTEYTISADLALTRRYDIRIQDLPLLCRLSLERHEASDDTRSFIFTEGEMSSHATKCKAAADAASLKRRAHHPAFSRHAGQA